MHQRKMVSTGKTLYAELAPMKDVLRQLEQLGVVDPVHRRNLRVFERYNTYKQTTDLCNHCIYLLVGEEENIGWSSVKKIVKKLSE